jgi:cell fate regulator YaaT (PSP1 superfamily)
MIAPDEYLVSYGSSGEFSRFRAVVPRDYPRGERVIVRSYQGLEVGTVLCRATPAHEPFLARTAVGQLLRPCTPEDVRALGRARAQALDIALHARQFARELELPLEILDAEVLLDGSQAIVYHLRRADCDYRPLVSRLARLHDVLITMQNLALSEPLEDHAGGEGCGKPDCGKASGGCSSCASGGCSSGTCGAGLKKEDVAAYLASLRNRMDQAARVSLL